MKMIANGPDTHLLSVYVANKPGVLARIAQVFARQGFNIDSLVVSPAIDGNFSRMTLTAKGDPEGLDQIIKTVSKLVDVLHCVDHTGGNIVSKELALIKLAVGVEARTEVLQIASHFKARTVDLTETSLMLMATGDMDKIDALVHLLQKFPIVEMARTGQVVMARGERAT